jgi:hypothetical protein
MVTYTLLLASAGEVPSPTRLTALSETSVAPPSSIVSVPNRDRLDAYRSQIIDAMNWYNHGSQQLNLTYGDDAWAYSQQFSPSHPLSKIFP